MSEQYSNPPIRAANREELAFEEAFCELPGDYSSSYGKLLSLSHAFRRKLAAALQPRLQAHLSTLPDDTYEQKKAISSWVNGQLHELGLTIRCPRTGKPAILVTDLSGGSTSSSRFRLEIVRDDGKRWRTISSRRVPELELTEDDPRREGFARWTDRVSDRRPDRERS